MSQEALNKPSQLLTHEENEQVFALLGYKRKSQCTAVVQLFSTEPPANSTWVKRHTGVLCFVKDYVKRSYFMRLYCLNRNELVWEQEVYDPFIINDPRPYLLTFEARDRYIALNFVLDSDSTMFLNRIYNLISNRMQSHEDEHSQSTASIPKVMKNKNKEVIDLTIRKKMPVASNVPTEKVLKEKVKKKINKNDIGLPTDFTHVSHLGFKNSFGLNFSGEDDKALQSFLLRAGISERQLNDRKTKAFIDDFILSNNVLESIKSEKVKSPQIEMQPKLIAPPVPARHTNSNNLHQANNSINRRAPPPPARDNSKKMHTIPTVSPSVNPSMSTSISESIPLPPPPPPVNMPLNEIKQKQSIEAGENIDVPPFSPIDNDPNDNLSVGSSGFDDARSNFLSEIRLGTTLRPVDQRVLNSNQLSDETPTDALALALRNALTRRFQAIQPDSKDDCIDECDSENEWEE